MTFSFKSSELRILVIEDDQKNAQLIGAVLKKEKFSISMTSNGADGIRLAKANSPDLIILDIYLPDSNGLDICEKLRASGLEKTFNLSTGLKLDPYFSFSKIIWAIENDKNINTALKNKNLNIGTIDSWILANLVDNKTHQIEITNASRTGLFNTNTEEWDENLLHLLDIDKSALPKIRASNECFGYTKKSIL